MRALRWSVALALLAAVALSGCREVEEKHTIKEPVTVEKVKSGPAHVTLIQSAHDRLGIETVRVGEADGRRTVPSGAVIVDAKGGRWLYVAEEPLVFLRHAVNVEREDAGVTYYTEGPPAGARVVTIGAAELHGAETGIGK
ncbi:MAG: hypothetical protein ACRD12_04450 [Acidimicrobiales bacterium]